VSSNLGFNLYTENRARVLEKCRKELLHLSQLLVIPLAGELHGSSTDPSGPPQLRSM
jgi:hypothetical protein